MDTEDLQRKLKLYQELDSEWVRAYKRLQKATTEEEERLALLYLDELAAGNSWADLNAEPLIKVVVDQRDAAQKRIKLLEDGINTLCMLWTNDVPVQELRAFLKAEAE